MYVVEVEFDPSDYPNMTHLFWSGPGRGAEEEGIEEDEEGDEERLWFFRKHGDHSSFISSLAVSFEDSSLPFTGVLLASIAMIGVCVRTFAVGLLSVGLFIIPSES
jgi:hypothetical protein